MRIDAHHHLWQYNPEDYDWINDNMSVLKQDFLLAELEQVLSANNLDGSVVVQARQSLEETNWLLSLAEQTPLIKGVVGWIDLASDDIDAQLKAYKAFDKLVGFRHVIQDEKDPNFMSNPNFIRGLKALAKYDFTFDLLIFAHQLPAAIDMLMQVPELNLVVDHIAKPDIKNKQDIDLWHEGMSQLASVDNVYCKISGMVTEAAWESWEEKDFKYFIQSAINLFGHDRVMFGSDWPVCLLAASYEQVTKILENYYKNESAEVIQNVFGLNACRFYQLN